MDYMEKFYKSALYAHQPNIEKKAAKKPPKVGLAMAEPPDDKNKKKLGPSQIQNNGSNEFNPYPSGYNFFSKEKKPPLLTPDQVKNSKNSKKLDLKQMYDDYKNNGWRSK